MVHVVPVRQLQQHLPAVAAQPEGAPPGQSGLSAGAPLAAGLVSEGLRLLPALHERAEPGAEQRQKRLYRRR